MKKRENNDWRRREQKKKERKREKERKASREKRKKANRTPTKKRERDFSYSFYHCCSNNTYSADTFFGPSQLCVVRPF